MLIKSKFLGDAGWKDLSAKNKLKDNGLAKALEKLKRIGEDEHDEQAKLLEEVVKLVAQLKKDKAVAAVVAALRYLGEVQGDAELALRDVAKAKAEHEKAQKAKAEAEKRAAAKKADDDEDDDEEEESPELLTTKLKPLLKLVAKGESMHALLAKSGKQVVVMLSRKPIPPARRKMLAEQLGGGSTKYYPGTCGLEAGATTFKLKAEVAGMSKLVKAALLEQTGLRLNKIKCRGEDGDDHDDDDDDALVAKTNGADPAPSEATTGEPAGKVPGPAAAEGVASDDESGPAAPASGGPPLGVAPMSAQASAFGARGGADVEVLAKEFTPYATKYGDLKVTVLAKVVALAGSDGAGGGFTGTATAKDKPEGRPAGTKKNFSFTDIADRELFAGFEITKLKLVAEFEISGTDANVNAQLEFVIKTKLFEAPAKAKLTLLTVKGGQSVKGPGLELTIVPINFQHRSGAFDGTVRIEYKASFSVDIKKVAAEVGQQVLEKAAKDLLKKEAEKQGVKLLGREAATRVLGRLGPLAAALGVGLEIGKLLNAYTTAPEMVGLVYETILGDFFERYQESGTLGKMWIVGKNLPRIGLAMVAAGVIGTVSGLTEVMAFKILGLDKLPDYAESLSQFANGVSEGLKMVREAIEDGMTKTMAFGALMVGVKTSPRHAKVDHASLEPIVAALHAKLRSLYRRGDMQGAISLRVKDARFDRERLATFAGFAHRAGMSSGGSVKFDSPDALAASLNEMIVGLFLTYLESNKLIHYNVSVFGDMDPDRIDPKLIDELYD